MSVHLGFALPVFVLNNVLLIPAHLIPVHEIWCSFGDSAGRLGLARIPDIMGLRVPELACFLCFRHAIHNQVIGTSGTVYNGWWASLLGANSTGGMDMNCTCANGALFGVIF